MRVFYIIIVLVSLFLLYIVDLIHQSVLMNRFMQGERRLSPISKKILERWQKDYKKIFDIASKIDTKKLSSEDKKNLANQIESLTLLQNHIESTIGTGVKRYKIRVAKRLQKAAKIVLEMSNKSKISA